MSASPADLTTAAVAMAPDAVLRLLADTARGGYSGAAPEVSLYLSGGQVLRGDLLRVGGDHGREVAVLAFDAALLYVTLAGVVAVSVADPQPYRDVLSAGALPLLASGEPVTKLALRRDFAATPSFPLHVEWTAMPDAGPVLANLARLLRALRSAVDEVRGDELGRRAWEAVPALVVTHETGRALSLRRATDGVTAAADLATALPRDLERELRRQLDAVL